MFSHQYKDTNTMYTVHLLSAGTEDRFFSAKTPEEDKKLLKSINEACNLASDSSSHIFFEPDMIIRIGSKPILGALQAYLKEQKIHFVTYDYPRPEKSDPSDFYQRYGESKNGIVIKNFELFLSIFHANAQAALTLSEKELLMYKKIVIENMLYLTSYSKYEEGTFLAKLAEFKTGYSLAYNETFTPNDAKRHLALDSDEHYKAFKKDKKKFVENHMELLSPIFKAHAAATISLSNENLFMVWERTIHSMCNMMGEARFEEGEYLARLAEKRLGVSVKPEDRPENKKSCFSWC